MNKPTHGLTLDEETLGKLPEPRCCKKLQSILLIRVMNINLLSMVWRFELVVSFLNIRPVLRIRIRRIHMFLGLLDPDPDPLVRGTDPDPFYHQEKIARKTLIPTFCDFFLTFNLLKLCKCTVPSKSRKTFFKLVFFGVWKVSDENSRIRIH